MPERSSSVESLTGGSLVSFSSSHDFKGGIHGDKSDILFHVGLLLSNQLPVLLLIELT